MMAKKRLVLTFPHSLIEQPITYKLVKEYDLLINILRARVTPEEEGKLVVDIEGKKANLDKGISYIKKLGLTVQPLTRDVRWNENRCTHCTACITICPTNALQVERKSMKVSFHSEKCIACELCIPACPYKAIEILL